MKHSSLIIAVLATFAVAVPAYHWFAAANAATAHGSSHETHMQQDDGAAPQEAGQSAFATIAEIVSLLEADPKTDWSRVDITALREHLVDMNNLMLGAKVSATVSAETISFHVEGDANVLRAIHAMVPAHAVELNDLGPWIVEAKATDEGAVLKVKSTTHADFEKARALGFFGLMAKGSHHQPHHLAMAKGLMQH